MLKICSTIAPAVALVLVAVLLLEPPALTPGDRVPTLRLFSGAANRTTSNDGDRDRWQGFLGEWRIERDAVGSSPFDRMVHPHRISITTGRNGSTGNRELVITQAFLDTSRTATTRVETTTDRLRDTPGGVSLDMTTRGGAGVGNSPSTQRYTVEHDRLHVSRNETSGDRETRLVYERLTQNRQ